MPKVIVIGLDGATFTLLDPWMDEGKLPNLREIRDNGVSGLLKSSIPPVTAPAWQCFMTGKNPGKHGVSWFMQRKPGSYEETPITSTACDGQTLWQLLGEAGYRVAVLNVPATYPPQPVNGVMISGLLTPPGKRDFVYPPGLLEEIEGKFGPYHLHVKMPVFLANLSPTMTEEFLKACEAMTAYQWQVAGYLLEREAFDFIILHTLATDMIQHWLWHLLDPTHPRYDAGLAKRFSPRILEFYQGLDRRIGELVARAGREAVVIVLSDHGFGPISKGIDLNAWLLREGYLQIKRGAAPRIRLFLWRWGWTPELCYRLLVKNLFRLPVLRRRVLKGRPSKDGFQGRSQLLRSLGRLFLSPADIDWARTRAYAPLGFGQIRVNLAGREPQGSVRPGKEYEALREELVEKLKRLTDPTTGERIEGQVFTKEEVYRGRYLDTMPDIIYLPVERGYVAQNPATFLTNRFVLTNLDLSATHTLDGILMAQGPGFRRGHRIQGANLMDLAPTILYLMGCKVPRDMDGRVLTELFEEKGLRGHPIEYTATTPEKPWEAFELSKDDQEEVLNRLKGLGYLD